MLVDNKISLSHYCRTGRRLPTDCKDPHLTSRERNEYRRMDEIVVVGNLFWARRILRIRRHLNEVEDNDKRNH